MVILPTSFFLLRIVLVFQGPVLFHLSFRIICLFLWRMSWSFRIKLHWVCKLLFTGWQYSHYWFYQSMSMGKFSILCHILNFFSDLSFSLCRYLTFLVMFIPRYLLGAIVSDSVFKLFFSACFLLVLKQATDFYKSILYLNPLFKLLIISEVYWWDFEDVLFKKE